MFGRTAKHSAVRIAAGLRLHVVSSVSTPSTMDAIASRSGAVTLRTMARSRLSCGAPRSAPSSGSARSVLFNCSSAEIALRAVRGDATLGLHTNYSGAERGGVGCGGVAGQWGGGGGLKQVMHG